MVIFHGYVSHNQRVILWSFCKWSWFIVFYMVSFTSINITSYCWVCANMGGVKSEISINWILIRRDKLPNVSSFMGRPTHSWLGMFGSSHPRLLTGYLEQHIQLSQLHRATSYSPDAAAAHLKKIPRKTGGDPEAPSSSLEHYLNLSRNIKIVVFSQNVYHFLAMLYLFFSGWKFFGSRSRSIRPSQIAAEKVPEYLFQKHQICDSVAPACENGRGVAPVPLDAWCEWWWKVWGNICRKAL